MYIFYNMVSWRYLIITLLCWEMCYGQVTKRENRLLSRKKRYLAFPEGSNFVVSIVMVKAVMVQAPTCNIIFECDLPFKLPSDTRLHKKYRKRPHIRHKREIFNQLASALEGYGYNGISCVKRMICEAEEFGLIHENSLVKDLIVAIFKDPEEVGSEYSNYCHNTTFTECDVSFLKYLMGGLTPESI